MAILAGQITTAAKLVTQVRARSQDTGSGTISTTESVEGSCTLTIPADWTQYDVDVTVLTRVLESGTATGNTTVTLRVRKTNASGTEWGQRAIVISDAVTTNSQDASLGASSVGETTTGSVVVAFTGQVSANSGQISWQHLYMVAVATRTD